jgi:hypothetical protein
MTSRPPRWRRPRGTLWPAVHGVAAPAANAAWLTTLDIMALQTANSLVSFFGAATFCSFT